MTGVRLAGVSKRYGNVQVIDDLSLDIRAGEFIVFLGPSGSGKSTLLRMIAGLETTDGGQIEIAGRRVDHLPPGQRDIAMVFQQYALYPHMTVRENLSFGLRNVRVPAAEIASRIESAARRLEITELLERRPGQLSGGQRQRVAIARAIVKKPALFLFDEPLSNLDAALRARTRLELAGLHQQLQATMILVTHDQVEAMTLADRIVVIHDRRIEQVGAPLEIYRRPATLFVAGFVGTPRMNLLSVSVHESAQTARVRLPGGPVLETAADASGLAAGEILTLGIRPEDLHVSPDAQPHLRGTIRLVERLGDRTFVHVELADGTIVAAEERGDSAVASGDWVGLRLDAQATHLFGGDGRRLPAGPGA